MNTLIPPAYNVNMNIDRANKNPPDKITVEPDKHTEFKALLKSGLYKSLYADGFISNTDLMELLDTQRRYIKCH
ncbi:MAG: hypothetical protein ACI4JB_01615 [Porcipelethomonas sp.]